MARTDPGHRATDLLAAAAGIAAALTAAALLPAADPTGEAWDGLGPASRWLLTAGAGTLGALLGAAVAGRWSALRTLVTPQRAQADAAAAAAHAAFAADRTPAVVSARGQRAAAPGIFVHAALAERRVAVLADPDLHRRLGPDGLDALCRLATEPLAVDHDDPLAALAQGVRAAADQLAERGVSDIADPA